MPIHSWMWTYRSKRNLILNPVMYLSSIAGPTSKYPVFCCRPLKSIYRTFLSISSHLVLAMDPTGNWHPPRYITTQTTWVCFPIWNFIDVDGPDIYELSRSSDAVTTDHRQYCKKTHSFPKHRPAFSEMVWSYLKLLTKYLHLFEILWYSRTSKFTS